MAGGGLTLLRSLFARNLSAFLNGTRLAETQDINRELREADRSILCAAAIRHTVTPQNWRSEPN